MRARVYKRGGRWGIDFTDISGRRIRRLVGSKKDAQAALAVQVETARNRRFGIGARKPVTLREAWERWERDRTLRGKRDLSKDRQRYGRIVEILGGWDCLVEQITADTNEQLRFRLSALGLSAATRNRHFALLRSILRHLERLDVIDRAPFVALEREPPSRDVVWTPDEVEAVLRIAELRETVAILGGYEQGLRLGEVCTLRIERLHFEDDPPWLKVASTAKTERSANRPLPMTERFFEAAKLAAGDRTSGLLLTSRQGGPWSPTTASAVLKRLALRAGVPREKRFHDLRHTYLTRLGEGGVELGTLADIAGHANLQTTRRYIHRRAGPLHEAIEKVRRASPGNEFQSKPEKARREPLTGKKGGAR